MELNATEIFPYLGTNGGRISQIENEDPRIMATSYVIYKVGRYSHLKRSCIFIVYKHIKYTIYLSCCRSYKPNVFPHLSTSRRDRKYSFISGKDVSVPSATLPLTLKPLFVHFNEASFSPKIMTIYSR